VHISEEKKLLQQHIALLKKKAVETFTEVQTLQDRCKDYEKQLKERQDIEKNNFQKVQAFANKFAFMSKMLQQLDSENAQLQTDKKQMQLKIS
jgi:hypothetical protein